MSYEIPEEQIAEDFAAALADLSMNSRYEISNLTLIARENTASALVISEALKTHIKQTSPSKKLPAFYVLDSIIKNVGTPYTLFFGRQLYSTFMESYALVDNNVRSKMVEMLKTWKEPVPGSMDTRPVFPPEVTRPIENALIKARTSFLQAHQEQTRNQQSAMGRGRAQSTPYRETPTPPSNYRPPTQSAQPAPGYTANYTPQQYPASMNVQQYSSQQAPAPQPPYTTQLPPNGQQYPSQQNGYQPHGLPPRPPNQQYPQALPNSSSWQQQRYPTPPQPSYQSQVQAVGYTAPASSLAALNSDIENLINETKAEWSRNPHEVNFQPKIKALLDLQTVLRSQTLPPDQISLIQNQVDQLKQAPQSAPIMQAAPAPLPPTPVVAPPPVQQPTLSSLLGPGALAALLARQSATPQPSSAVPATIRSPPQNNSHPFQPPSSVAPATTPVPDPASLLGRLRAAGMLPGLAASTAPTPLNSSTSVAPPPFLNTPPSAARTPLATIPNDVILKPASLKIPRPHLIASLYEQLGAPCTQCGRRFQSDQEGKKKKAAHMDWHFHVRQRMDEAESRGQHRSWYVDELDWIRSREVEGESGTTTADSSQSSNSAAAAKNPKLQFIPAPDDPALAAVPCPICQEKFEMKWLDEAQEFVWMDAKKVGDRIYHASCFAEATKDVNTKAKRGTPEPVLGKRKAEDDGFAFRAKIKSEPVA
ncbi:uncharacterized protein LY89DRAFT_788839 [Mollisia scopiformis]|uniref:CID domain-containing protein n=1 Tax=Mollisia scopiformis TaxID=149040 RepID=A0A132B8Y7_MOLSC|nr:uncharacterized protein LY89DRAFT_788839 [Mollisia scopiformis]KUJ08459.1 hypothetical protein LY89DRAFT_788839 [Mollisia scopiformis]